MKQILLLVVAVLGLSACSTKTQTEEPAKPKTLVLYYSQTGATKAVAEAFKQQLGADIASVEAVNPYDGDFQQTIERCQKEMTDSILPELKPLNVNLSNYDVIFLGYPVWFGTYAPTITSLLKNNNFEGKTIVPFCTFGSGGLNTSTNDVKNAVPKATIKEGYGVRNARIAAASAEIEYFLKSNGYIEGEFTKLADYSTQQPVTEAETEIFNTACGSYQFPLGTPITFGSRESANSIDYLFVAESNGPDGNVSQSQIKVTMSKSEGAIPEFTEVIR